MQSINNKLAELDLLLNSNLKHIDVLCFTEHWLKEDYLKVIKIDQYKLVILAERITIIVDPVYMYKKKKKNHFYQRLHFQGFSTEKDFLVPVIEIVDFKYITVCIYRIPHSDFWIFLKNLEIVIQIAHSRNNRIVLHGDWNLNFM